MCQVTVVRRAGYYRSFAEHCPAEEKMLVRSIIQSGRSIGGAAA
jgi:hypothetical protein